jgi:hypothetical protein
MKYGRTSELLGFIPARSDEGATWTYYSVETTKGRVAPVFFVPEMWFDSDPEGTPLGPAILFKGCDDGHMGIRFESREAAIKWIEDCKLGEFEQIVDYHHTNHNGKNDPLKIQYAN